MTFFTYNEFKKFISEENSIEYKTLFETLYYLGLRKGEMRALKWNDINFDEKTLKINKSIIDNINGKSFIVTSPKTKSSIRTLPIPNKLFDDLILLLKKKKAMDNYNNEWFIFGTYKPIGNDSIRRRKNYLCKKANVKQIRIHDFRHSCASLLINNGANITIVAKYLGHAKINETLNTYSHMFKNKLYEVIDLIDTLE